MNISMKDPLNDKQKDNSLTDGSDKPKGIRKFFAWLCGGRNNLDLDNGNRIDLFATPAMDQSQQDTLPDYRKFFKIT